MLHHVWPGLFLESTWPIWQSESILSFFNPFFLSDWNGWTFVICLPLTFPNTNPEMAGLIKTYLHPWKQHKRNVNTSIRLNDFNILWFRNPSSRFKSLSYSMNIEMLQRIFPNPIGSIAPTWMLPFSTIFHLDFLKHGRKPTKKGIQTTTCLMSSLGSLRVD